jgi:hypothetical protein
MELNHVVRMPETEVIPFEIPPIETPEVTDARLRNALAQLEIERERNARLRAIVESKEQARTLTLKVSEKGALSIYGLGRFPLTAYKEQWLKILAIAEQIKAFIKANDDKLTSKK